MLIGRNGQGVEKIREEGENQMLMYLKSERIKRETEKAYLIQCPENSYAYARATFWMSKSQAKLCQCGSYRYLQVKFPSSGVVELKRYVSRRQPPQVFQVEWSAIQDMFRTDHDLVWMRIGFEYQNQAADRAFEQQMKSW